MLLVVFAALAGGLVTGAALIPHGLLVALLAAPLGGSLSAVLAGLVNLQRNEPTWRFEAALEAQTDAMVADLRGLMAPGRVEDGMPLRQSRPSKLAL
ncbi:hypothetical protein [Methylobacterium symbioticum]|uniref:Uncharacterized protein n=1 Tax=Methylobacterium symbioticum TaxID=2584084 RepID=A0A509E8Y1_9HYPH|nr:hypothetical protein [Methylobacterium symbioticum]VUD70647.1 hypothetical protein MET9862_01219 [Methylobacterium symbioticum]